ncbi:ANR family transcriptional regulator [Serratia marcescens]|uniref:ANR family transcriptional regulator n=1 Tax=Serratia marcescens TaxID=615 RepID=UPI00398387BF
MKASAYRAVAQQAIQHEHAEEFIQAATFWRRAEAVAMKPVNQDWAATRAELCEKRHSLTERRALLQESASERAMEAAKTKAKKKMAEALEAHMNNSTSGENQ